MTAPEDIESILQSLPSLTEMLDGDYTSMALVRSNGRWYAEQNDAVRSQGPILAPDKSTDLIDFLHAHGPVPCHGDWWVRPLSAGRISTAVFERRPTVNPDGLSPHTLELLRAKLEPETNGVVFGTSRRARTGFLLALTRHLPAGLVLYVGPVPPVDSEGDALLYVAPPRHDRDRRELAPLVERASAVLFDGPICRADLRLLLAGSHGTNRWVAVDAPGPDNWTESTLQSPDFDAEITTHVGVRTSTVGNIRLDYFALRGKNGWNLLLGGEDVDDGDIDEETTAPSDDDRLSARRTSRIDEGRDAAAARTSSDNQAPDFDVETLMEEDENPDAIRESGEIDVPAFASDSQRDFDDASHVDPNLSDALRGQRIDDDLPNLVASSDIDELEIPELAPEQLRQTYDGPVDVDSLKAQRDETRSDARDADSPPPAVDPPWTDENSDISDDPTTEPIALDGRRRSSSDDEVGTDSGDSDDQTPGSSEPDSFSQRPSSTGRARSLRRTSQLGVESSTSRTSSEQRPQSRRRRDSSGRRVLPVPSSSSKRGDSTEVTTRDLSPVEGEDSPEDSGDDADSDDRSDKPPPIDVDPGDTSESTLELDVSDELDAQDEESSSDDDT